MLAQKNPQQENTSQETKEVKGLDFMGLRLEIIDKRHELLVEKKITPSEALLLEKIELGTIAARNEKHQICSKAEFYLEDLSSSMGYKELDKLYKLLKLLEKKGLILRKETRSKGKELLGLNPEIFGQILIDSQNEIEKKRFLKLVPKHVDNPKNKPTGHRITTDELSADNLQIIGDEPTIRRQTEHEKPPLDSFRLLKISLERENEEVFDDLGPEKGRQIPSFSPPDDSPFSRFYGMRSIDSKRH